MSFFSLYVKIGVGEKVNGLVQLHATLGLMPKDSNVYVSTTV